MSSTSPRTFSQADYDLFAQLTGDDNPIHVDPEFAARTRFGRTLAHGMMLFSTLSGEAQRALGAGRVLEVELMFPGPTYVGDPLAVTVAEESTSADGRVISGSIVASDGQPCCVAKLVVAP